MIIDFRKLQSFIKIVDAGSISRAAGLLGTAQPALSQQVAALEQHFGQKLLTRFSNGVAPTQAGLVLYRHAEYMLKYLDHVSIEVGRTTEALVGTVSVGLATYSSTATLALPILRMTREQHPGIVIHINDTFGQTLSELVMSGRLDMAVIYARRPIKGVTLTHLFNERLYFVASDALMPREDPDQPLEIRALEDIPLVLPGRKHFLRKLIDEAFARARITPHVVAEIESIGATASAVQAGLGASILSLSVVKGTPGFDALSVRELHRPVIQTEISLCTPEATPMSEAALAVKAILLKAARELIEHSPKGVTP